MHLRPNPPFRRSQIPAEIRAKLVGPELGDAKLADVEYEIEPADEVFASIRYPHQQFTLE